MPSFFLAWQYLRRHRLQAAVMIAGVALALFLPLATHWLINAFDQAIGARAAATPCAVCAPQGAVWSPRSRAPGL